MSSDCRTRDYTYARRFRRGFSGGSNSSGGSHLQDHAARIFEHFKYPTEDKESATKTFATFPESIEQIEEWLDVQVKEVRKVAADPSCHDGSSSVKLLFVDEKKCVNELAEEFPISKLHNKLKIYSFTPAHYMTSFSRFPLPIDTEEYDGLDEEGQIWDWRYCISHPFDWDMVWVYFPPTKCSIAIVRTWFDGYDNDFADFESISQSFEGSSLANPMFVGLIALQILTTDAVFNAREKGNRLYEAQKATGFHTYDRLRETEAGSEEGKEPDLAAVTKEVLGVASNLTGWENASYQLSAFSEFIVSENTRFMNTKYGPECKGGKRLSTFVEEQSRKLAGDVQAARHDILAWLSTGTFQLQGVLNLISQKDAHVSIQIAKETKRDSTSMTAIAVVTMMFLPGTFTAAFFSLPFFEDELKAHGPAYFWVYWAVTIPVTIFVYLVWVIYNKFVNPRIKIGT